MSEKLKALRFRGNGSDGYVEWCSVVPEGHEVSNVFGLESGEIFEWKLALFRISDMRISDITVCVLEKNSTVYKFIISMHYFSIALKWVSEWP